MTEIGLRKEELDTPALWVDLERMERNIAAVAGELAAAGVAWRPHIKGIKVPAIAHQLLRAGAIGVTCAKVGEAEVMAAAGIRDILIANQVVGPQKVTRLAALQRHAEVKAAVDHADNVAAIGAAAVAAGVEVGLVVEVDTGLARAGVLPGQPVVDLACRVAGAAGVRFRGVMTWEGHNLELKDPEAKRQGIEASIGQLLESAELCRRQGLPVEIVSGGGSGTYGITAHLAGMTEIQAGGAIFCDQSYQQWGVALESALYIQARVTSRPARDRVICDAGFKASSRGFPAPRPVDYPDATCVLSAEHGIIRLARPDGRLRVGDVFDLEVGYADATVHQHDRLYGVRGGVVEVVWEVQARGKLR
jgi:D-serine deaminase-like pyridoxal phosphate-dependent protein